MEFTKHFDEMLEERDIKRKRRLRFMRAKDLDSEFDAKRLGVPWQSIIKIWIAERLKEISQ